MKTRRLALLGRAIAAQLGLEISVCNQAGVHSLALFGGPEQQYRYWLSRQWSTCPPLVVIMLNPSTADAFANDRTVSRVEQLAREQGYGGYVILNVGAYRATKPRALKTVRDPVGPHNRKVVLFTLQGVAARWEHTPDLLCAYGATVNQIPQLKQTVGSLISACATRAHLLKLASTQHNLPRHPLYLKNPLTPERFDPLGQS